MVDGVAGGSCKQHVVKGEEDFFSLLSFKKVLRLQDEVEEEELLYLSPLEFRELLLIMDE